MRMGPVSLFALIIVLCLAVLAVLSATSANAGQEMAHRQAAFTADEYANETAGQLLYAEADGIVAQVREQGGGANAAAAALAAATDQLEAAALGGSGGAADDAASAGTGSATSSDDPASGSDAGGASPSPSVDVTVEGTVLSAHIQAASGRCLDVRLEVAAGPSLSVASWTASTLWVEDDTDTLWAG